MVHELRHRHLEAINIVERIHGQGPIATSQRNLGKFGGSVYVGEPKECVRCGYVVTFDRSIKWLLLCQGSGDKSPQLRTKHSFAMQ